MMTKITALCLITIGCFAACKKDAPPAAPTRAVEQRVEAARPAAAPVVNVPAPSDATAAAREGAAREGAAREGAARGSKAKGDGVKTCPVSGEEIGSGGMKPAELAYKGKTVRFCCKACIKDFEKDPEAYLKN